MLVLTEPGFLLRRGSSRGGASMSTKEQGTRSFRAPMAWKFFLLMALIVPSMLAVSWVGGRGMQQMKARLDVLYEDNLTSIQAISRLSLTLEEAEEMSLRLIGDVDPVSLDNVRTELRRGGVPRRGAGDRLPAIDLGVVRRTGPARPPARVMGGVPGIHGLTRVPGRLGWTCRGRSVHRVQGRDVDAFVPITDRPDRDAGRLAGPAGSARIRAHVRAERLAVEDDRRTGTLHRTGSDGLG